jgi:proteasome lid subunit RPN8/RPN11
VFAVVGSQYRDFVFVERFVEVANSSCSPGETFEVVKSSLDSADIPKSATVVGFVHTHPPGVYHPSDDDIAGLGEGLLGAVLCDGILLWYDGSGEKLAVVRTADD